MSQSALRAPAFALAACPPLAAHAAEALTGAFAQPTGARMWASRWSPRRAGAAPKGMAGMEILDGDAKLPLLRTGARVPPDLTLHVLAPKAGT